MIGSDAGSMRTLKGTAVVTGANTGIGRVTAIELAKHGYHVILASRSLERTQPVVDEILGEGGEASFVKLELGSFASVRAAAESIKSIVSTSDKPLKLLVNNAGLGDYGSLTESGFERCFGANHLGHYLLTRLLMAELRAAAPSRIINVSSVMHYQPKRLDLRTVLKPSMALSGMRNYNRSKLANVLFTLELQRRLVGTGITACAVEPGGTVSDGYRRVPQPFRWFILRSLQPTEAGAATTLHCAVDIPLDHDVDLYYAKSAPKLASEVARDADIAKTLWDLSASWVGLEP